MLDAQLIAAAIASRAAFERIQPHITDKDMGPYGPFWWQEVTAWYERDPRARAIDLSLLVELARPKLANKKYAESVLDFAASLPEPPSPDNVVTVVLELKRHNLGAELGQAMANNDTKAIRRLLPKYQQLMEATDLVTGGGYEIAPDWHELHAMVDSEHRIPVAPESLNAQLRGGVWPASHLLIFGRTDVGKSTFAINMAAGFLWSGQRVLYAGTEDAMAALKYRMMGRLANMTPEEIERDKPTAEKRAREREDGRLFMAHFNSPGAPALERAFDEFEPTVLILDQIRSYRAKGDGMTQRLEEAGIEVRELAAKYKLVVASITQANDRTQRHGEEPPAELLISDIDSSRTGLPGTTDLIVGIGATSEMKARGQRLLSPMKNKFSSHRDAKRPILVQFDLSRSKVK